MAQITLNISTCPNDTFMFDALLHGRIPTEGLSFGLHMADIEELNRLSEAGAACVTKLSVAQYARIADRYKILPSGAALGRGSGPLLVSGRPLVPGQLAGKRVAVPGFNTTANLLLSSAYGNGMIREERLFSEVAPAVLRGEADAGVLIHEERFTYAEKGLSLVSDLGGEWERKTGLPIPLGIIVVSRELDADTQRLIGRKIRESIAYAFARPSESRPFVREHAQELSDEVTERHIRMFVNDYSLDMGEEGREAVRVLLREAGYAGREDIFV